MSLCQPPSNLSLTIQGRIDSCPHGDPVFFVLSSLQRCYRRSSGRLMPVSSSREDECFKSRAVCLAQRQCLIHTELIYGRAKFEMPVTHLKVHYDWTICSPFLRRMRDREAALLSQGWRGSQVQRWLVGAKSCRSAHKGKTGARSLGFDEEQTILSSVS